MTPWKQPENYNSFRAPSQALRLKGEVKFLRSESSTGLTGDTSITGHLIVANSRLNGIREDNFCRSPGRPREHVLTELAAGQGHGRGECIGPSIEETMPQIELSSNRPLGEDRKKETPEPTRGGKRSTPTNPG